MTARPKILNLTVLVGALGYFVDIYDLILFSIVRVASLRGLGVPEAEILDVGVRLLNCQMIGMLVGGILWGVLGDKKGRLSVLFGSIFLYSSANAANAFVSSVDAYAWLRFIAGVGLAGELGAAITLVCETLPKETRGYGTMIVAGVGLLGGVVGGLTADLLPWRKAYLLGGGMGFLLLFLRVGMLESGMYASIRDKGVRKGDLAMIFSDAGRLATYLRCVLIGVPIWYVFGILVTFAPEIARALGCPEPVSAGKAVLYSYVGIALGDFSSGLLSQLLRSRKKAVFASLALLAGSVLLYLLARGAGAGTLYALCALLGFATGYWAIFVTIAAEQFGTNLRSTVTTTVPNFVRGSVVLLTSSFLALKVPLGVVGSAGTVGLASLAIAAAALAGLRETYGKDLDYLETP